MRSRNLQFVGGTFIALTAATAAALAQAPDRDTVQKWFDAEWKAAQTIPDLGDASITWRMEFAYVPSESELEELRARVEGRPDHPERGKLRAWRRAFEGEPEFLRHQLWMRGQGQWRFNIEDGPTATPTYTDITLSPSGMWTLSRQQLSRAKAGDPAFDNTKYHENTFWPQIRRFMFGGIASGCVSCERDPLVLSGTRWSVTVRSRSAGSVPLLTTSYEGHWDAAAGRGFTDTLYIRPHPNAANPNGARFEFSGWSYRDALARWMCDRVVESHANGPVQRVYLLEEVAPNNPGRFNEVAKEPAPNGTDAVRGTVTFTSVLDYQGEKIEIRELDGDGTVKRAVAPRPTPDPGRWPSWVEPSAGGLVIGACLLVAWRRNTHNIESKQS
ncbi:MAG: hypothetical protein JNM07_13660 [Phycisphaerae bacterium]|nr:hypothetical protein [Phycisphaerae bacterium]